MARCPKLSARNCSAKERNKAKAPRTTEKALLLACKALYWSSVQGHHSTTAHKETFPENSNCLMPVTQINGLLGKFPHSPLCCKHPQGGNQKIRCCWAASKAWLHAQVPAVQGPPLLLLLPWQEEDEQVEEIWAQLASSTSPSLLPCLLLVQGDMGICSIWLSVLDASCPSPWPCSRPCRHLSCNLA